MDSRGFRYELEAVLTRASWRQDECSRELAQASAALARLRARQEELAADYAIAVEAASAGDGMAVDVVRRAAALRYLGQASVKLKTGEREVTAAAADRARAQDAVAEAHRAVESLRQHKDVSRREFAEARAKRQRSADDESWLSRHAWRDASAVSSMPEGGQ